MKVTAKRITFGKNRQYALVAACIALSLGASASALTPHVRVALPAMKRQAPSGPARVSGGVMAGQVLTKVNPVYPQEAISAGITGSVVLHAIIGEEGTVQQLSVVSGPAELRAAAMEAVKQWTYRPFLLNGNPTAVDTTITVNFAMSQ
jgi:TonB family protein